MGEIQARRAEKIINIARPLFLSLEGWHHGFGAIYRSSFEGPVKGVG